MLTTATKTRIRHLRPGELPTGVWPALEHCINYHWAWAAVDEDDKVVMVLLTAPAHGMVILLRLWAAPDVNPITFRQLFREVARECLDLGMVTWMVTLSHDKPDELRLAKMVLRVKGVNQPWIGFLSMGRLDKVWTP